MKIKNFIAKLVVFIMAVQILNLSIYAQDFNPIKTSKTLYETNEINSIAEYVGEVVLHHNNQFPEYPNDGHKDLQFLKHFTLTAFAIPVLKIKNGNYAINSKYVFPVNEHYYFLFYKEINPPPPKADSL